jgi:hypothetical protein
MPSLRSFAVLLPLVWLICSTQLARTTRAQDFRVYTAVTEISPDATVRRVVARSLTLFHSGRVYDHMEQLGELVVFEPIHERFTLIRDHTAATVTFEELRQYLDVATRSAEACAAELRASRDPASARLGLHLQFQLQPEFEVQFDPATRRLRLRGSELLYEVRTDTAANSVVLAQYLAYADWAARLNSVLHSQGVFPAPREVLNRTLRERELLPVSVTLQTRPPAGPTLRADHEFRWQLQPIDKDQIHQWERLRQSDRLQWVTFREYQQRLLASAGRNSR